MYVPLLNQNWNENTDGTSPSNYLTQLHLLKLHMHQLGFKKLDQYCKSKVSPK